MKNFNLTTGLATVIGIVITVAIFIVLLAYFKTHEVILLLLFPIAIAVITYLITYNDTRGLKTEIFKEFGDSQARIQNDITDLKKEIINYVDKDRLVCHGTKYAFPKTNRSDFWNSFLINAHKKFILLGNTNKSWLNGGSDQSTKLGKSILAILENNGTVKIISENNERTIERHKKFIQQYVLEKIKSSENKNELLEKFYRNFAYKIQSDLNFTAVVSDNRLIILPRMNIEENQEKCMVLEINHSVPEIYKNYLTDIEAIFDLAPEITFKAP